MSVLALPCRLFTARSIIGVALRPLKLTDPERTESTKWTESVEGHEAKRSALLLPKTGTVLPAIGLGDVKRGRSEHHGPR